MLSNVTFFWQSSSRLTLTFILGLGLFISLLWNGNALAAPFDHAITLEQVIRDTQTALQDLPQKLEQPPGVSGSQFRAELETRKDLLDNAADTLDILGEKLSNVSSSGGQNNPQALKKLFDSAADTIEVLADDIEDAEKGHSPALRAQVDQHIQTVNQVLEQVQQTFESLSAPSPV